MKSFVGIRTIVYWGYVGWGYIGIMEKKMEAAMSNVVHRVVHGGQASLQSQQMFRQALEQQLHNSNPIGQK